MDPFLGSGTTGAVAKSLHRNWIGIEKEDKYIKVAQKRIDEISPGLFSQELYEVRSEKQLRPMVNFSTLVENGYLNPGEVLYFNRDDQKKALIKPDSRLQTSDGFVGSLHQVGRHYSNGSSCNGWDHWYKKEDGDFILLDSIRVKFIEENRLSHD